MSTEQDIPAIVRPREYIENVRADALRAGARVAATGAAPNSLIDDTISWASGQSGLTPFTGRPAPRGPDRADITAEIKACRTFLQTTAWSQEAAPQINRARAVLKILEWLTGTDDRPPTYCRDTQPGDLVGGRGGIVRPVAEIQRMIAMAQAKLASGQTSHSLGAEWHHGVIETLRWVLGDRPDTPILRAVRPGLPDGGRISIEQHEAENHLAAPGTRPDIPYHYADAVACTCRWLLGGTTTPPVTNDD
jgi:hypothetical protein